MDTVIDLNQWKCDSAYFSVGWSGYLIPPVTGKYTIGLWSGNNFEVYISDTSLFADANDPDNDYSMKEVTLEKGKPYKFRVEVAVDAPKSQMQLLWYAPDGDREKRALDAARKADVVVFCAGLSPHLEGEEDGRKGARLWQRRPHLARLTEHPGKFIEEDCLRSASR